MSHALGRRAVIALGLALLVPSACLSPTLPLPPPDRPDTIEGPDTDGNVRLSGTVPPNGVVYALNSATDIGAFQRTREDGHYDFLLAAVAGDEILLSYSLDRENSQTLRFAIPAP